MQTIQDIKNNALRLMKSAGFPIAENVEIAEDEKLKIMGYTTEENGKPKIVVAKWANDSGMLDGLIIHELSHVYRIETNHPSHNSAIHNKVISMVIGRKKLLPYQQEIVYNSINTIQDLYADDIFFKVRKDSPANLSDFFLSWIHSPVKGKSEKDIWTNAQSLVSTAFAQANLERHHVEDTDGKVQKGVEDFLLQINPEMVKKFEYFNNVMVHLPEKITEEEFGQLLLDYLRNFLDLTNLR